MAQVKNTHSVQYLLVKGRGRFPTDMLRYDSCCPATESDSYEVDRERDVIFSSTVRTILLRRFTLEPNREPTVGRWNSFGWTILACSADMDTIRQAWDFRDAKLKSLEFNPSGKMTPQCSCCAEEGAQCGFCAADDINRQRRAADV